jgi:DNA-binding transcriptional LysR family regulator
MEMQQIRYFVALCEVLNFTRAAERCNVSQPSLTRAIRLLEDELGGPLFNRERNQTHLTELGRLVEPHIHELLTQAQSAKSRATAFFQLKSARLRLGIAHGVPLAPLDEILGRYVASYPDTEIEIVDERTNELEEGLRGGDFEVVVLPRCPPEIDDFHYYLLAEDRLHLIVPPDHPLAAGDAASLGDIARYPLICGAGCLFWEAAERHLGELGLAVRPKIVAGSMDWLLDLVAAGIGVGLGPCGVAQRAGLVSRPVAAPPVSHPVSLATKRGRLYSPPVRVFVELALKPRRSSEVIGSAA